MSTGNDKELANHEIVTLAVFLCGGDRRPVDTEDVAIAANNIAPGRFAWRKYEDQINLDTVRKRLWDAKTSSKGGYLLGSEKDGWSLTPNGLAFAKLHEKSLADAQLSRKALNVKEKRWLSSERARMLASEVMSKYLQGGTKAVTLAEACSFFRIDGYLATDKRREKVLRAMNVFRDDPELRQATIDLGKLVLGE